MAAKKQGTRQWVSTMHALRRAPSAQHFRRHKHSRRVAELAEAIARSLELSREEVAQIRRGALLHDIGNLSISEEILLKPGPLTPTELRHIRAHVERGLRDFRAVAELQDALPIVRHHHEWVNGSGYPEGLKGDAIPLGARVVAAAEAYVVMTSDRPWRAAKSHEQAIRELEAVAGTQLDEGIVERLVSILHRRNGGE